MTCQRLSILALASALLFAHGALATEASLPPVTRASFVGTWETVFNDTEAWLVRLRVNRDGSGDLHVLHGNGPYASEGYFTFRAADVRNGKVRLRAVEAYAGLGWGAATLDLEGDADSHDTEHNAAGDLDGTLRIYASTDPDDDEPPYTEHVHFTKGSWMLNHLGAQARVLDGDPAEHAREGRAQLAKAKHDELPFWLQVTVQGRGRGALLADGKLAPVTNGGTTCTGEECSATGSSMQRPPVGSMVTLTAQPERGSAVGRWSSTSVRCPRGAPTCTIRVPPAGESVGISVRFDPAPSAK